jgi:hypothetical protein
MVLWCFGLQQLTPAPNDGFTSWWLSARRRVQGRRRCAFDSLVTLVAWLLWIERNDMFFSSRSRTAAALAIHSWSHS